MRLNFADSDHGFRSGFADLPANYDPPIYELDSGWRLRPAVLRNAAALYIAGHNRSDDLFMFWKRKVTGLRPNTSYRVRMKAEFVSSYRRGTFGIGGSPADSVFIKLGASPIEPIVATDTDGQLVLNLDKGNQSQDGRDARQVGTVALPRVGAAEYGYVRRNNFRGGQEVATDSTGSLWVFFGTDSGFEGKTELWYTRLWLFFTRE